MRHLLLFLLSLLPLHFLAAEKNPLMVEMISEMAQIRGGQTCWIGFRLQHPKDHHSYWRHPGVVGLATKVTWDLPDGFHAGDIVWPAPQKLKMGAHTAQGYRDEVLLMVPITAPKDLTEPTITFRAKLDWMCCGIGCHPAWGVPFSVTVKTGSAPLIDPMQHQRFATARAQVPRRAHDWQARARYDENEVTLIMQPAPDNGRLTKDLGDLWFFSADGAVHSSAPQLTTVRDDGIIEIKMKRYEFGPNEPTHIRGVLRASRGWNADGSQPHMEVIAPAMRQSTSTTNDKRKFRYLNH